MIQRIWDWVAGFWTYLEATQTKSFRIVHLLVAALIILQILDSSFMAVHYQPTYALNLGVYFHIGVGSLIAILAVIMFSLIFKKRGFRYFYPYLFNDYTQLKKDCYTLLKCKLPNVSSGGIAAIVQGLGLLALVIVLVSGFLWLNAWVFSWSNVKVLQGWHKTLTGLIEFYIYAHGAMGIIHYLLSKAAPQFLEQKCEL